jgi:hypothetical protein
VPAVSRCPCMISPSRFTSCCTLVAAPPPGVQAALVVDCNSVSMLLLSNRSPGTRALPPGRDCSLRDDTGLGAIERTRGHWYKVACHRA